MFDKFKRFDNKVNISHINITIEKVGSVAQLDRAAPS